jgi:transposase
VLKRKASIVYLRSGGSGLIAYKFGVYPPAVRIKPLQHRLSRKRNGSHSREKGRARLAKAWRDVSRWRDDDARKRSHRLATTENMLVEFGALQVRKTGKNLDPHRR